MGLPTINITFKQLAQTINARSGGILCIIVQDDTKDFAYKSYATAQDVDSGDYEAENYTAILRAFDASPRKVVVARMNENATATAVPEVIANATFNWVCAIPTAFQQAVANAVKAQNATGKKARKAKALVAGVSNANDMHVVNVANTTVTLAGAEDATAINLYLPRLGGLLAACPLTESVTYKALDDLEAVSNIADVDTSIDGGNFCLFKDDDTIRVARGVNTLQTITADITEDMKKITVVEAMDAIQEDIVKTFKANYLGRVKNTADNQALFVAEVIDYFNQLAAETIIDVSYADPVAQIDIQAMRDAWTADGVDVSDLTDAQVKAKTYRAVIFVNATCRILDAMEDLTMSITLG